MTGLLLVPVKSCLVLSTPLLLLRYPPLAADPELTTTSKLDESQVPPSKFSVMMVLPCSILMLSQLMRVPDVAKPIRLKPELLE